jgi:tRNA A37 threonylcarbamoyladenosine synthetase subunit TsaC/SUA5/YrdC
MNVILAQTDTTVGFLSRDSKRLEEIKMRHDNKPFLKVFADFKVLRQTIRIPTTHKRFVRYASKTTFVVKNQAFRHVDGVHARLIRPYCWLYSTSANKSGGIFERGFCTKNADIIIEDSRGLVEKSASSIYKLTSTRCKKLR